MSKLVCLLLLLMLAGCQADLGGATPVPASRGVAAAATTTASTVVPAAPAPSVTVTNVTAPQLQPGGDDLDYTTARFALTAQNGDQTAHSAEAIVWFHVTAPGLHGPGFGERDAYTRVALDLPPDGTQTVDVIIFDVHTGSKVRVTRTYIRQVDDVLLDDRALDPRQGE